MPRNYADKDIKLLYGLAGGLCSLCKKRIVEVDEDGKEILLGEMAHIIAHSPKGPRADANFPKKQLNTYSNLIALCPTCHKKVDKDEETYTVEKLQKIKRDHEQFIRDKIEEGMANLSFAELEVAIDALSSKSFDTPADFSLTRLKDKIIKNNFTKHSQEYITRGLNGSETVRAFLSSMSQIDQYYPERLKKGFQQKYSELQEKFAGDELFFELFNFASLKKNDFMCRSAGLAVLVYLFQVCDIFEK